MKININISTITENKKNICEKILRSLPAWFGIEEAIKNYSSESENLSMYGIQKEQETIGFLTVKENNSNTVEIHVMGILPEYHKQGMGSLLIDHIENIYYRKGYRYLHVKTLGFSSDDKNYQKTRNFYIKNGFIPIDELSDYWNEDNPCLFLIKELKDNEIFKTLFKLQEKNLTLSTAESCSGGLIASNIISYPGASSFFIEGIICYSNESKSKRLNIPISLIEKHGAVSRETAVAMAEGICKTSGTDIGISTTGIAGPTGGTEEKPVGTVYIAIVFNKKTMCKKFIFEGDRNAVRNQTTETALRLLKESID